MSIDKFLSILAKPGLNHNCFYHFSDTRNLPGIREHGLLSMRELKARGLAPVAPGGNQHSFEADEMSGMDAYVHLCMLNEHPMEYLARKDGRIEKSVFLKINPEVLWADGVLMTAEVSNKSGVEARPVAEVLPEVDLKVIYTRTDWKDAAVKERLKAAKKYEILVPNRVWTQMILNMPNG